MNWQHFQTHNEAPTKSFEAMCNQLFDIWCHETYDGDLVSLIATNGAAGDGGVESIALLSNTTQVGLQAKWFPNSIDATQFTQIKSSIKTALRIRPDIAKYIVCVPRDLASVRYGKNGKLLDNNERTRWEALRNEIETSYTCELVLWDESQLETLLQKSKAAGIYRFWFEKSEISKEVILHSYNKQRAGWLIHKYIPDLHASGKVSEMLYKCLGTFDAKNELLSMLGKLEKLCNEMKRECSEYKQYDIELTNKQTLSKEIDKAVSIACELNHEIHLAKELVRSDTIVMNSLTTDKWYFSFSQLISELKESQHDFNKRAHKDALIKAARSLDEYDISMLLSEIRKTDKCLLLLLGEPGTGKTHAVAGLLQKLFEENQHVAILIRAKDYAPNLGWSNILAQALGLSGWGELEIWNALEALACRFEVEHKKGVNLEVHIKSKVLICIDGVDERVPYADWIERFREVQAICSRNGRIRFCVTCRPYVFSDMHYGDALFNDISRLPMNGDVSVSELYPKYIQHYQIDDADSHWLRWSLKTPLALRSFCDLYRGQKVSGLQRSALTITRLLESTIAQIEKEFVDANNLVWSSKDFWVRKILLAFLELFISRNEVERDKLLEVSRGILGTHSISSDQCSLLLDHFENYGLIHSIHYRTQSLFEQENIKYSIGIQPFFDYLAALYAVKSFSSPEEFELSPVLAQYKGALQMLSIILLEDHGYLVTENPAMRSTFKEQSLFSLACFALSNVSPEASAQYAPYVLALMQENPQQLRQTVSQILIPVSKITDHPLGPMLLHGYLQTFSKPGKRDLIWSLPDTLWSDSPWQMTNQWTILDEGTHYLDQWDSSSGLPLIYAWLLTSCDNTVRCKSRQELMRWALISPEEYWILFENVIATNDPQMKEDLLAIAMGLVFSSKHEDEYIVKFRDWILTNVFAPEMLNENYDAAVRYYCHSMMERFYLIGLLSEEQIKQCRPPYATSQLLSIHKAAFAGTRMGGYGPIDYDLSRYVLCDPINRMFFSDRAWSNTANPPSDVDAYSEQFNVKEINNLLEENDNLTEECRAGLNAVLQIHLERSNLWKDLTLRITSPEENAINSESDDKSDEVASSCQHTRQMSKQAQMMLEQYSKKNNISEIRDDGFVNALAYAFLIKVGWNDEEFIGQPNGGKPGEILGADIVIMREHRAASHGAMSEVMTFAEKYVWCARNEILGFLADRLPFFDDDHIAFLEDYSLFDDFPNPAQELHEYSVNKAQNSVWFLPEELLCEPENTDDIDCLKKWIYEAPVPSFNKWISPKPAMHPLLEDDWITLYSYNSLTNQINGETLMWISSGIVSKNEFSLFQNDIVAGKENLLRDFDNVSDYHTSTQAQCYLTPKEICWMNWKKEYENPVEYVTISNGKFASYKLYKCVEECVGHYHNKGDMYYMLPSKRIRQYLDIVDGNGHAYCDKNDTIVSKYSNVGSGWEDAQSYLWVDRKKLQAKLDKDNMTLFWIVRLQRQATSKGKEKHPDVKEWYNRSWLYWQKDGEWNSILYDDAII